MLWNERPHIRNGRKASAASAETSYNIRLNGAWQISRPQRRNTGGLRWRLDAQMRPPTPSVCKAYSLEAPRLHRMAGCSGAVGKIFSVRALSGLGWIISRMPPEEALPKGTSYDSVDIKLRESGPLQAQGHDATPRGAYACPTERTSIQWRA